MTADVTSPLCIPSAASAGDGDDGPSRTRPWPTSTATVPPSAVSGIDPRRVTRLAMYTREALFVVDLDDCPRLAVEREVYYELLRALERDPGRRLLPVTAGLYDAIWRVEPREAAAPVVSLP